MPGLRLVFLGTPHFAVPALRALAATQHSLCGVISQPDRPRGRGKKLEPTPVKQAALELGLEVLQPHSIGDPPVLDWLSARTPDLGVVVAFGQFVPKAVRERPEVMECYLMTGDADYLLRVLVPDVPAFERFILDFLSRVPGVGNIKSSFALKQVKYQTALPLSLPSAVRTTPRRGSRKR